MAIMVIGLVAGCGKALITAATKIRHNRLLCFTLNNPFFVTMKEGVEAQAKALGLRS